MNMLNTEMRALCSFTEEEQELFQLEAVKGDCLEFLDAVGVWHNRESDTLLAVGGAYRLKLIEGEWYTYESVFCNGEVRTEKYDVDGIDASCFKMFRPASKAEIEAVKPKLHEGFTVWSGGKMPVSGNAKVDVILSGEGLCEGFEADSWEWTHKNSDDKIIAYRVLEPEFKKG